MKTIYLVLTRSNTFVSRMIHYFTSDNYTHVSIAFDDDFHTLYSSARKNGRTMFPAGPCKENLHSEFYKKHNKSPCAVYKLEVSDKAYGVAINEIEQIMVDSDSYHYNIIGLLLCRLNIPYHRKHYFFCSQFVGEILDRSCAMELPKDTSLMRPSDYMDLPELLCCYQGSVNELVRIKI